MIKNTKNELVIFWVSFYDYYDLKQLNNNILGYLLKKKLKKI